MATYKRLTLAQRYLIQTLQQQRQTQHQIAQQTRVSQATISRELARNAHRPTQQPYQAEQAQKRAATAKTRAPYKLKGELLTLVISRLRDRLSPEQICGELERLRAKKALHHETIYRYIYRDQKITNRQYVDHETLTEYLRIRHRKHYKKRGKPAKRELIPNRVSIDHRPAIVETNTELGHWDGAARAGRYGHWQRPRWGFTDPAGPPVRSNGVPSLF